MPSSTQGWQGNKARPEKARVLLPGFFGLFQVEFEKTRVFLGFFKFLPKFCQNSAKFCQIFAKFLPKNPYKVSEMSFFEYFNTIWNVWIIETILVLFDWNNTSTISIIFYLKKPREKPGLFEKTRAFPGFFKFSGFLPTLTLWAIRLKFGMVVCYDYFLFLFHDWITS